jgi:hypothetical protein
MSAEAALQKAFVAALKAQPDLNGIIAGRVYDRVPASAVLPYVNLRDFNSNPVDADCMNSWEIFVGIDVWSEAVGKVEASRAASFVADALHEAELPLDAPYVLTDLRLRSSVIGTEDDGITTRARMTFVAQVDRT